jgi:hypothetical protein
MLELVNQDRQAASLAPVRWDDVAARAGALHTEEMVRNLYFSHWNEAGLGPDHRYMLAGGLDNVMENIHMHMHTPGFGPQTADEWRSLVREAEQSLMNSPGHRANILKPEHTHVGIGIAYNAVAGRFLVAQEFTNHYVTLQPIPASVLLGGMITLQGKLEPGASAPLVNLAYEPFPQPMSVAELNQTSAYSSPAQTYEAVTLDVDADGKFSRSLKLNHGGQAGFYHVRVWVESQFGKVFVADPIVRVQ